MDDLLESQVIYDATAILCVSTRRQLTELFQWFTPGSRLGPILTVVFAPFVFFPIVGLLLSAYFFRHKLEKWAWTLVKQMNRLRLRAVAKIYGRQRNKSLNMGNLFLTSGDPSAHWEVQFAGAACYAIQGRRPRMEDRFTLQERLPGDRDLALFAIYDGHGGEFAAEYVQDWLVKSLPERLLKLGRKMSQRKPKEDQETTEGKDVHERNGSEPDDTKQATTPYLSRKNNGNKENTQPGTQISRNSSNKDNSVAKQAEAEMANASKRRAARWSNKESAIPLPSTPAPKRPREDRWDISQELYQTILDSDKALIVEAKKQNDIAGSTALVAILDREKGRLAVANVGDSRGVMCDSKGKAIPLSFDHKPQQLKERRRIQEAGGFVTFNGVWRVAGILATSRALGDFPLKDRNLLTAEPDVLTFDLKDHKAHFMILASDGLWDTFTNEEAVAYTKAHIHEPLQAAKGLTTQAYQRGSVDNITVLIVDFTHPSIALT